MTQMTKLRQPDAYIQCLYGILRDLGADLQTIRSTKKAFGITAAWHRQQAMATTIMQHNICVDELRQTVISTRVMDRNE